MKILLVDCDGTIRQPKSKVRFINKPTEQEPIPGAVEALNHHVKEGWLIVGITNQAGVAAGHKSLDDCIEEQQYTLKLFPQLRGIYFCPDYEGKDCIYVPSKPTKYDEQPFDYIEAWNENINFRKPGDGMIKIAIIEHISGEPDEAWMIGDRPEDEQAANSAGINFMWADIWRERWRTGEYKV